MIGELFGDFKDKILGLLRQTHLNKLCMGEERNKNNLKKT